MGARLAIFRSADGMISLPPLLVNLVATQPSPYRRKKGKGKGPNFPPLCARNLWYPDVRTRHPMGRAPATVWIARRDSQIIVLIHAMDGRIALGQVDGLAGCIPAAGGKMRTVPFQKDQLWDLWGRHSDLYTHRDEEGAIRCKTRARFCVPISARIIAILPRETEVLVLHKLEDKGHPQLLRVPLVSATGARTGSFVALADRPGGGPKGSGKCIPSQGPWY